MLSASRITGMSLELCLCLAARYLYCGNEQQCHGTVADRCSSSLRTAGGACSHVRGKKAMDMYFSFIILVC